MIDKRYAAATIAVVAIVVTLGVAGTLSAPVGVTSAQSSTIDSCTTIDSPGTYTLGSDISTSDAEVCIRITASDVTLDGNGHTIAGGARWPTAGGFAAQPNSTDVIAQKGTEGIYASGGADAPLTNVVVRDLTTIGWDNGTRYEYVDGGAIRSVTARNAVMNAIRVSNADDNTLGNITLINNSEPNYDIPGGGHGLYVTQDSTRNTITDLEAHDNKYTLIFDGGSHDNVARDVTSTGGVYATYLYAADDNRIVNLSSTDNRRFPVYTEVGAENNVFRNLRIESATLNLNATNFALKPVPSASVDTAPSDPEGQGNLGQYVQLYTTTLDQAPFSVRVAMSYSQAALGEAPESSVSIWRYQNGSWSEIPGSSVDADANTAAAVLSNDSDLIDADEFQPVGIFAPLAEGTTNPPTPTPTRTPADTATPTPTPSSTPTATTTATATNTPTTVETTTETTTVEETTTEGTADTPTPSIAATTLTERTTLGADDMRSSLAPCPVAVC